MYMDWKARLHGALIAIADLVNRQDVDARLLTISGVKLDRALFPLLTRIPMHADINVAELANLVGRDHSTVSRQVVKLEQLGLILRPHDPADQRSRRLVLSEAGQTMIDRIDVVRRQWMEDHFAGWSSADRDRLIALLDQMLGREKDSESR